MIFANDCLLNISGISRKTLLSISAFCFLILLANIPYPIWFFEKKLLFLSAAFLFIDTIALLFSMRGKKKNIYMVVLVELCAVMLTAGMSFQSQSEGNSVSAEHFSNVMTYSSQPIEYIRESDSDFYRIRKEGNYYNYNDPMLFNYPGLSHYSSSEKIMTIGFLNSLGQQTFSPYWANGDLGESRALDCLLGVRYYIGEPVDGYETVSDSIQKNPLALPLAISGNLEALHVTDLSNNAAANINSVYSALCGDQIEIFTAADSKGGTLTVADNNVLYFCIDDPRFDGFILYRNGEVVQQQNGLLGKRLILLGTFDYSDELEVLVFDNAGEELSISDGPFFYYEDFNMLSSAVSLLNSIPVEETITTASQISLQIESAEDQVVVLTIPDDEGWNILLDGQPTGHGTVFHTLIAIPVSGGRHMISLQYIPPGLKTGILLSLISLVSFSAFVITSQAKGKKPHPDG